VEFRHASWTSEKNIERTLTFLKEHNLAYVCCDEPQGFPSSAPLLFEATSDFSVVRMHGRNKEAWEKTGITTADRFNYLYSEDELKALAPNVKALAAKTRQMHVLFNNCYEDKAVVNAGQMKVLLD